MERRKNRKYLVRVEIQGIQKDLIYIELGFQRVRREKGVGVIFKEKMIDYLFQMMRDIYLYVEEF